MSSKHLTPSLARELENLINNKIDASILPYVKGKSIRIGHVIIREARAGFFLVFDTKENRELGKMFCKTSAVALARTVVKGSNHHAVDKIKRLDQVIEKHYTDALFYKHTMKITKDDTKWNVAQVRYEIAASKVFNSKDELDTFIYY